MTGAFAHWGVVLPVCLATFAKASVHPLDFQEYILEHIWGRCALSPLTPDGIGCYLDGADTCSDRLSEGPMDADVELILGNLPPSTYVHFWAPYESLGEYDPLQGPNGVSLYGSVYEAFPKYYDLEFNGGNVKVNQSGYATIRVRSPATFVYRFLWWFVVQPIRVYLRVCKGDNIILHPDTLYFDLDSHTGQPEIWIRTKSQATNIDVIEARPYATPVASSVQYNIPPHLGTYHFTPANYGGAAEASTTTSAAVASPGQQPDISSLEISSAREQLDLDALDFSPVYTCFESNQFFSQFAEGCVASCEAGQDSSHGQCVRQEVLDEPESFWTTWDLDVQCEGTCGEAAHNETLHRIRLQVGMLLDVPFQEADVVMVWEPASSRRLAATARTLVLRVTVNTKRLEPDQGKALLDQLIANVADAGFLLQLPVLSFEETSRDDEGLLGSADSMTSAEESYEAAYEFEMPIRDLDESSQQGTESGSLSIGIIIGVAASVVIVGATCGVAIFFARQRAKRRSRESEQGDGVYVGNPVDAREAAGGKAAGNIADMPPVLATEIGNPIVEQGSGAGALSSV